MYLLIYFILCVSEEISIISLNRINGVVFVMEVQCVFCDVTEFYVILMYSRLQNFKCTNAVQSVIGSV